MALVFAYLLSASQNLSYTCPKTITVVCGPPCVTLNVQFPDIRSQATDYTVNNVSSILGCYPLVLPGVPGSPTNLTIDDRYSAVIPITFNFPFYGLNNTSLVVSTNGYISFDLSKTGLFSHYGILNNGGFLSATSGTPENLPSVLYDRSLIFGPYHDLDPGVANSPTKQIKYDVQGTAPNRKWIVSFYKVPLFLGACNSLIENTHQIILHESSGLIEVSVFDKQICNGWNQGRAMIGLQNELKNLGIVVPGRQASDAPWGSIGMNETWRFIPKNGAPLYRSVELLNAAGAVIATGDTTRLNANTFEWNFTNVCPPPNVTTMYVVKTTYQRIDAAGTFYSLDTINVLRQNVLNATTSSSPTTCGASVGSITITPTSGVAPYTYTLNGGNTQTAPGPYTYTGLAAGTYTVTVTDVNGCSNSYSVTVTTTSTITGTATTTPTSCPLSTDGTITVTPTSGTAPYTYSLDGGPFQSGNVFTGVAPGSHTVVFIDAAGCTGSVTVTVTAGSTPLSANVSSTPTSCPTVSDGTITVTPTSGSPAYQYSLDGGPNQPGNVFTNVAAGAHTVTVTDAFGCTGTFPVSVVAGPSLTSTLTPTNPPCANINNGSILITPTSGTAPYQYSLNGGPPQPGNLFTGLAPGPYTIDFTDAIGCTGTNSVTLTTNAPITATATLVLPLCNGDANGSITLIPSGGVSPYEYSINAGVTYQASPLFPNLGAGTYNFLVRDALGCIYAFSFTLGQPTVLTAFATVTAPATCPNNDGSLSITAGGGTPAYEYSINNGVTYQASNSFTGLATGIYPIRVRDLNGCTVNTSATISLNDTMRLELGPDTTICAGTSVTLVPQTNAETDTFKWIPATWLNFDTARTPVATPPDTIKYYLTAKWGICQRTDSIRVNILHKPVAHAGNDTTICYKTNALLNGWATNTSGPVNFAWSPPDSLNTPNAATTIARMDTTRQFTLTVTDAYGCNFTTSDSMWVIMQPVVPAFAGNDTIAMLNKPHQLSGSGGLNYLWSPAGPLNNPFIQNPKAVLTNDTYFTLLVTDAIGCSAEDGIFVRVYVGPEYHVPNAFTPNGDGLNDVFRPIPSGMRSTAYFRVFNRFGQLVFETSKWLAGWDGTFKGKKAETGTYVWTIKGFDVNGRDVEMSGTVILLR